MHDIEAIKTRIHEIVKEKFGRSDEELMATGIIDSLRAVQLALALAGEFTIDADSFEVGDMRTVTVLSEKIHNIRVKAQGTTPA